MSVVPAAALMSSAFASLGKVADRVVSVGGVDTVGSSVNSRSSVAVTSIMAVL